MKVEKPVVGGEEHFIPASGVRPLVSSAQPAQTERRFGWSVFLRWCIQNTLRPAWSPPALRAWFSGYLLAVALQLAALAFTLFLVQFVPAFRFIALPFYLVVLLVSVWWGAAPGILATLIGVGLLKIAVLHPFVASPAGFGELLGWLFALIVGITISMLSGQLQRARSIAVAASTQAERAQESLYQLLMQAPTAICVLRGPDYRFELINPLAQQIFGDRYVLGSPLAEVMPTCGPQGGITAVLDQVYTTGKSLTLHETRVETPQEKYFNVIHQPLRTPGGAIDGVMLFYTEVTEQVRTRKEVERLTREREQEAYRRASDLEAIFEAIADPVFIIDAHGERNLINNAGRELLRVPESISKAEVIAQGSLFELYDEDGKFLPKEEWPQTRILAGERLYGPTAVDVVMHTNTGRIVDLSVTGAPLRSADGSISAAVLACRDVTSRRLLEQQTQEALQSLLTLAEALVALPSPQTADTVTSSALAPLELVSKRLVELIRSVLNCKRVSITLFDPLTGEPHSVAVVGLPPEEEQLWKERRPNFELSNQSQMTTLGKQFANGSPVVLDLRLLPPQENPYGITIMLLAPMRIEERLIGILSLDHEGEEHLYSENEQALAKAVAELAALILERERLLEERAESQASLLALEEANRLKDEFIGIAGHELRTPLTTIKASVQLARRQAARLLKQEQPSSEELVKTMTTMQQLLDRAERQVGMQNRLVNDLLDVSRIETGRLELHPALHDLGSLVGELVEDQKALTPERRISLASQIEGELLVLVDADRLRQVVTNYLSNALKYSEAKTGVQVRVSTVDSWARVEVVDQGPGLSEAQQKRIWERFYRTPGIEVKTGSGVGLGLGLHISRMIIERHGGKVGVQSVQGEGSTFWFMLPKAEG